MSNYNLDDFQQIAEKEYINSDDSYFIYFECKDAKEIIYSNLTYEEGCNKMNEFEQEHGVIGTLVVSIQPEYLLISNKKWVLLPMSIKNCFNDDIEYLGEYVKYQLDQYLHTF